MPGDGEYDLTIEVDPPEFMRHDEENGDRYAASVEVTFEGVEAETGQDWSGPRGRRADRNAIRPDRDASRTRPGP